MNAFRVLLQNYITCKMNTIKFMAMAVNANNGEEEEFSDEIGTCKWYRVSNTLEKYLGEKICM